jgi:hypothetical protein
MEEMAKQKFHTFLTPRDKPKKSGPVQHIEKSLSIRLRKEAEQKRQDTKAKVGLTLS